MEAVISGDVHTPDEGEQFALASSTAVGHMALSIEQSVSNLEGQERLDGPAIEYQKAMHAAAAQLGAAWQARAARFAEHIAARNEHISPDTARTVQGTYVDPAGQQR